MPEEESWEKPFRDALDAVRGGDFDEVRKALQALGFNFVQGKGPQIISFTTTRGSEETGTLATRGIFIVHTGRGEVRIAFLDTIRVRHGKLSGPSGRSRVLRRTKVEVTNECGVA